MPSHQYAPSDLRASQLAHTATVKYKHLSFWVENSQSIWLYRGLLAKINSPMGSALRSKSLSSPKICIRKSASASKGIEGVSKHDFLWVSMQFLINALLDYLFPFYNLFHKATFLPFSQFTDVACNVVTFLLIAGAFRDKDVEANFVHVPLIMAISEAALQIKVHSPVMLTCLPYKSSFPKTLPFSNYVLELTGLRDDLSQQKSTTPHIFISPSKAKCSGGLPGAKLRDVSTDEYSLSIFDTLADGEVYFVIEKRRGI